MSWAKYAGYHFATKVGVAPAAITTSTNHTGFDRLTYDHMIALANAKVTSGTGTLDIKVQDSANNSTGWADYTPVLVHDNNLSGVTTAAFPQISTDGISKLDVDLSAAKRYIRFVTTASDAGSPNFVMSVDVLLDMRNGTVPGATA